MLWQPSKGSELFSTPVFSFYLKVDNSLICIASPQGPNCLTDPWDWLACWSICIWISYKSHKLNLSKLQLILSLVPLAPPSFLCLGGWCSPSTLVHMHVRVIASSSTPLLVPRHDLKVLSLSHLWGLAHPSAPTYTPSWAIFLPYAFLSNLCEAQGSPQLPKVQPQSLADETVII